MRNPSKYAKQMAGGGSGRKPTGGSGDVAYVIVFLLILALMLH